MKKFFIFISLVMSSMLGANAQVQTATLQQTDGVQVFYGIDALVTAVNAAQDGNTIYLSAGNFNGVNGLSKSIKIIGAGGFNANEAKNTVINSAIIIDRSTGNYVDYLELEGFIVKSSFSIANHTNIPSDYKMIKIKRIRFDESFSFAGRYGSFLNIEISQCVFFRYLFFNSNTGHFPILQNVLVSNSIITNFEGSIHNTSSIVITNSVIFAFHEISNFSLQNNIIVVNNSNDKPNSANNNIFTGANNFPEIINQSGNWENVVLSDLFVNQPENKWDASYDYHLKTPGNYIGTDGTQVGIYGGLFPWNPIPSNPQILESKVEPTTTNDGKLNFQIKAEAQQ